MMDFPDFQLCNTRHRLASTQHVLTAAACEAKDLQPICSVQTNCVLMTLSCVIQWYGFEQWHADSLLVT